MFSFASSLPRPDYPLTSSINLDSKSLNSLLVGEKMKFTSYCVSSASFLYFLISYTMFRLLCRVKVDVEPPYNMLVKSFSGTVVL